jgi:hypothetical protein
MIKFSFAYEILLAGKEPVNQEELKHLKGGMTP